MQWDWRVGNTPSPNIPGFRLHDLLGSGGMGAVYRATEIATGRDVAIKVLHPLRASPTALARFDREAELLARFRHPNVVAVHAHGKTATGVPYLVCERVAGRHLDAHVAGRPPEEIMPLLRQLFVAVAALHAEGIAHRDLKPSNVLVDEESRIKIIDLGVSWGPGVQSLTQTGQFLGTPLYASPERLTATGDHDARRGDVWSLGVMAHELLTGELPFRRSDRLLEFLASLQLTKPNWGSVNVPRPTLTALSRALEIDPTKRFSTAAELLAALDGKPRGRSPLAPIGLLLGLGIVLVALLLWQGGESGAPDDPRPIDWSNRTSRARALSFAGQHREALQLLSSALQDDPSTSDHYLARAIYRSQLSPGEHEAETESDLDRAVELDPTSLHALVSRSRWARTHQRLDQADADSARAVELDPADPVALTERAVVLAIQDQGSAAQALLLRAHDVARGYLRTQVDLGEAQVLLFQGEAAQAKRILHKVISSLPSEPRAHFLYAEALMRLEQTDAGLERYALALDLAPHDSPKMRLDLARLAADHGRDALALEQFSRLVDTAPVAAGIGQAATLLNLGRPEEAERACDAVLERLVHPDANVSGEETRPRASEAYVYRALARAAQGDIAGARRDAERALVMDEGRALPHLILGSIQFDSGEFRAALGPLDRALTLSQPPLQPAARRQAHGYRALCYAELGDGPRAKADLDLARPFGTLSEALQQLEVRLRR